MSDCRYSRTPAARPFRRGRNVGTLPPADSRLDGFGRTLAVTEQYPKGLGNTVSAVSLLLPEGTPVVEKTRFSAFLPEIQEILRKNDIKNVILVGAEAHICMLQTALDLKAQGYAVSLPFECTASRTTANRDNGLAQMSRQGITVSNVESILFQLLGDAKHPAFKTISKLIQ